MQFLSVRYNRNVSITEKENQSLIGQCLQHSHAEITKAVKLEKGKDMEAGLAAFQNEENQYQFVIKQKVGNKMKTEDNKFECF